MLTFCLRLSAQPMTFSESLYFSRLLTLWRLSSFFCQGVLTSESSFDWALLRMESTCCCSCEKAVCASSNSKNMVVDFFNSNAYKPTEKKVIFTGFSFPSFLPVSSQSPCLWAMLKRCYCQSFNLPKWQDYFPKNKSSTGALFIIHLF